MYIYLQVSPAFWNFTLNHFAFTKVPVFTSQILRGFSHLQRKVKSENGAQCLFSSKPFQRQRTLVSETASSYMVSIYIHCICIISVLLLLYVSAVIHFVCYLVWFSRLFRGPGSIEKNFPHKLIVIASSLYAFWLMKGFIGMLCFR